MAKILVAYATKSGSTAEVAAYVGASLRRHGYTTDVRPIAQVTAPDAYEAVVVGAPMLGGWHREASEFLRRSQAALAGVPTALFVTALTLTHPAAVLEVTPVFADPSLAQAPKDPAHLSFKESHTTVAAYMGPVLKRAAVRPVSIGIFAGKLDYDRLDFLTRLYVRVLFGTPAGDYRNWAAIDGWAAGLAGLLERQQKAAA